jgi:hypothetical protein
MCKELLTSKTAWYSDRCKTSWKVKVSKSNVSLFQLQASVLGTKDTEFGLWATPNTMDYLPPRSAAGTKKIMEGHRKGRTRPSNLREQVDPETMKMYPTPTATERSGINPKTGKGAGLSKLVKMMYPTPTQDSASERTKKYKQGGTPLTVAVQEEEKRMYVTPTTQDARIGPNNIGGNKHRVKRGSIALADQILFPKNTKSKMYPTPRASAAMNENLETVKKRVERRGKLGSKLEETIATEQPMMYPTPTRVCEEGGEQSHMVERTKSGGFVSRRKGTGVTYGAKLSDAMLYLEKMYPTPTARDYKDAGYQPTWKPSREQSVPRTVLKNNKPGGKLNPTFVEFLMGFPMNWTKTDPTESKLSVTQSSHKSQESSD